jgi:hypothetical protein
MPQQRGTNRELLETLFEVTPDGWLWLGSRNPNHGRPMYARRPAYRVMWEEYVGPIPTGYEIDHIAALCKVYGILDVKVLADQYGPAHLEAVTPEENRRRALLDFCAYGHDIKLFGRNKGGWCKECKRLRNRYGVNWRDYVEIERH